MPIKIRPIRVEGNVAYVTLSDGREAVIDAEDINAVICGNWTASSHKNTTYAYRRPKIQGHQIVMTMHRQILGSDGGLMIDHIDGNGLNNRRSNLRFATASQNACNSKRRNTNTSKFKGVCWSKAAGKWMAQIVVEGKNKYLGLFITPDDAHTAYEVASREIHGSFGRSK